MSFRSIKPDAVQTQLMPTEFEQFVLLGGYRGDLDAFSMPLDASPYTADIKFERTGVRRDFGWAAMGAAGTWVSAILDHFDGTTHQTLRLTGAPAVPPAWNISVQKWTGAAWAAFAAGVASIDNAEIVSAVSIQDKIVFCRHNSSIWTVTAGNVAALVAAVTGDYVFSFEDRLIVLRSNGDPQSYAWSRDGIITDFTGSGSGETAAVNTNADAVDPLQAGLAIAHNSAALFRRRNIMRMYETGNIALAVAAVPAVRGVGTDSPFSVISAGSAGVLFLGHDCMVYLLTPSFQLVPVGQPILQDLKDGTTEASRESIAAAYNFNTREYSLLIEGTTLYIFDLGMFLDTQQVKWRTRSIGAVGCPALGSPAAGLQTAPGYPEIAVSSGVMFTDSTNVTQLISSASTSKNGTAFTGIWRSPALNRGGKIGTLRMLTLRYRNGSAVNITVKASGNGGQTWTETKTVALAVCTNEIKEVNVPFDAVTGPHLCFQIELDNVTSVEIIGYQPRIAERGGFEYA